MDGLHFYLVLIQTQGANFIMLFETHLNYNKCFTYDCFDVVDSLCEYFESHINIEVLLGATFEKVNVVLKAKLNIEK